jgi:hypothetical protein
VPGKGKLSELQFLHPVFQRIFQGRIWNSEEDTEIITGGLLKKLECHHRQTTQQKGGLKIQQ